MRFIATLLLNITGSSCVRNLTVALHSTHCLVGFSCHLGIGDVTLG